MKVEMNLKIEMRKAGSIHNEAALEHRPATCLGGNPARGYEGAAGRLQNCCYISASVAYLQPC